MARELLERRVVEEKKPVTVKLAVSKLAIVDAYAKWLGYDRAEVIEALAETLLDSKEFNAYFNNGSNGKGK